MMSNIKLSLATIWILLCSIILLIIFTPIFIYRWILINLAPILKSYTHILSPQGHFFMSGHNVQTGVWANIIFKLKIRGNMDLNDCKAVIANKLVYAKNESNNKWLYPEFQEYCEKWGGFYFWKQEKDFRLDQHIQRYQGSSNNGRKLNQAQLHQIEDEYLRSEFSLDKSPWEILLIDHDDIDVGETENDEKEEACLVVLFKFHHSLADGSAIYNALMKCCDEPPVQLKHQSSSFAPAHPTIASRIVFWLTLPFTFALGFAKISRYCNSTPSLNCLENVPFDLSPATAKKEINMMSSTVKVKAIKTIACKYSVSFTSVLLAAMTGGFREFLLKKMDGRIPQDALSSMVVPDPSRPNGLVNSLSLIYLKLPIGVSNLVDRLHLMEKRLQEKKQSYMEQFITNFILSLAGYLPRWLFQLIPSSKLAPIGLSFFTGPLKQVKINGYELFDMNFTVLSSPHYATVRMFSYENELKINPTGDYRVFTNEDLNQMLETMNNELNQMENDALNDSGSNGNGVQKVAPVNKFSSFTTVV